LSFFSVVRSSLSILYSKAAIKRENNIKVTSLNSRMRYPQIFINHSGVLLFSKNFSRISKKSITFSYNKLIFASFQSTR
ncbi:hypothetical protein WMB10_09315, partial [Tetragenococcus halophilus]|uniref:hypothetical protein n=1 Tax=Tetragenococcus halophilus TaxID=51669 RepID=UPI0030C97502